MYASSGSLAEPSLTRDEGFCESPSRGLSNSARFCSKPVRVKKRLKRSHWCVRLDYRRAEPNARLQFANENNIDFGDIADRTPTQGFDVPQGREVGEYQVRYALYDDSHPNRVLWDSLGLQNSRISLP